MINFYDQVPSIYTKTSRDFQYLSWLINIVLNSVKHNVDDIYNLPNTKADPRLTDLLAMTLGFKVKRKYDQKQLATIVSIIPNLLKYKGTVKAVTLAGKALITASGATGIFDYKLNKNCLEILLPKELVDTTLFMDLLPYILPAGITCKVIRQTVSTEDLDKIDVKYRDVLRAGWYKDIELDETSGAITGLTGIFDSSTEPIFTNFKNGDNQLVLNSGLMSNDIIPIVEAPIRGADPVLPIAEDDFDTIANDLGTTVVINKYSTEPNDYGTTVNIGV
jgi:hypothetical protein